MTMINALNGHHIKTLFSFFLKSGIRAKRSRLFFLFSLIPPVIYIIIKLATFIDPQNEVSNNPTFDHIGGPFYFQLFISLLCLFYGSSVMNDEIDNKTLIYLTTVPVSRASLILGKYLAHVVISLIIIMIGLFLSYAIVNSEHIMEISYIEKLGVFAGVAMLSIVAYSSLFTMLGTLMKKSILLGLFFILGWESIVQFFPGVTQKLTINHYIKSLLPIRLAGNENILSFQLQPSPALESILMLLMITIVSLGISIFIFYKKEYVLSDIE
ncbi:MAG TPA: ABC transporter permease subunit [Candidatus Kapabacteria bacterium]|nr:ABC transporter permease subunit [Candidatus Kapabacteria bacterium]